MAAREIKVEIVVDESRLRRELEIAELHTLKLAARLTISRINRRLDQLEQERTRG